MGALIVDEIFGRAAGGLDGAFKECLDLLGRGFGLEHGKRNESPGEMIKDKTDPIGERERLGECSGHPGHPEAGRGDHGQIGVPRIAGLKRFSGSRFNGCRLI